MKIKLTKEQIVEALANEPIGRMAAGAFVTSPNFFSYSYKGVPREECQRCAVGVIIDHVLSAKHDAEAVVATAHGACAGDAFPRRYDDAAIARRLAAGDCMGALSDTFETVASETGSVAKARRTAVRFVRKHFPATVVLDINGFSAKRGIRRVK